MLRSRIFVKINFVVAFQDTTRGACVLGVVFFVQIELFSFAGAEGRIEHVNICFAS